MICSGLHRVLTCNPLEDSVLAEIFFYLLYKTDFCKVVSNMACVCGFQVIASDVNQDGLFEIMAIDNSGNIACKNLNGKMVSVELFNFPSKSFL